MNTPLPSPPARAKHFQFRVDRDRVVRGLLFVFAFSSLIGLFVWGDLSSLVAFSAGQRSPRTVISNLDFAFEDKAMTAAERDRAAASVPPVLRMQRDWLESSWRRISRLMDRLKSGQIEDAVERWNEGSRYALTVEEARALARFGAQGLRVATVNRLLRQVADTGIVADRSEVEALLTIENSQIVIEPGSQVEVAAALRTPSEALQLFEKKLLSEVTEARSAHAALRQLAADALQPNLQFDRAETHRRREARRQAVAPVLRHVTRGQPIIYQGQEISEQALEVLSAYNAELMRLRPPEARRMELSGQALLVLVVLLASCGFLWSNHPLILGNIRQLWLLVIVALLNLALVKGMMIFCGATQLVGFAVAQYAIPMAVAPVLVGVLLQPALGVFMAVFVSVFTAIMADRNFSLLITGLVCGFVGVYFTQQMRRRSQLVRAGLAIATAELLCIGSVAAMTHVSAEVVLYQSLAGLVNGALTVFLVSGLLPVFEFVFQVTTDMRLLELSDLNHPLLKKLCLAAPGTYHHSLVVANLAESAAEAIGANPVLARVCAYYHDIGKLAQPRYFTENQPAGANPHDHMAPAESFQVIAHHVREGEELARKHRLSAPIIEVIRQHHGTTVARPFFHKARQAAAEAAAVVRPFNAGQPDATVLLPREDDFRYHGPKPSFRESAIISLADAIEGATRSLRDTTAESIRAKVNEIVNQRFQDGQLDECDLTIREIRVIAERFTRTLLSMMHTRVAYPKDEPKDAPANQPDQQAAPPAGQQSKLA